MQGINKKLLWATLILAAVLIGLIGFLLGSSFAGRNGSPAPSGEAEAPKVVRTPKEILLGQHFWSSPDFSAGMRVLSETEIDMVFGDEVFVMEELTFCDPYQDKDDWINCTMKVRSKKDDRISLISFYITENDSVGAFINTYFGSTRTSMYPTIKNPMARFVD